MSDIERARERRYGPSTPDNAIIYGRRASDRPKKRRAQAFVVLCHWIAVGAIAINLATGMRLAWGYEDSALGGSRGIGGFFDIIAPQGAMITWHLASAWVLAATCVLYIVYLLRTRESRRVRLRRGEYRRIATALRDRSFWRDKHALWSANVIAYWVAFALIGLVFATGVLLYQTDWSLDAALGGYVGTRLVHAVAAYVLLPWTILHIVLQWKFQTFWSIFRPVFRRRRLLAGALAAFVAAIVTGLGWYWESRADQLRAARLPDDVAPPRIDGAGDDAAWKLAEPLTIHTVKGANIPAGRADIEVKALHDGRAIYFRFRWADPTLSAKRYPLQKTRSGWRVLGSRFHQADETSYYEDKLALFITAKPRGSCADTCHVGRNPLGRKRVTWGLHYTPGEIADLWHWKYVRTNFMGDENHTGWADDQHVGPPTAIDPTKRRYTGGYHPDPKTGGGYRYNFTVVDPEGSVHGSTVRPIAVPMTVSTTSSTLDPSESDRARWWIHEGDYVFYRAEIDPLRVGTLLPNIIVSPFEGDRGDVRAKGHWRQGTWTLEMTRALDTGSRYDVALTPGKSVYISVSVFDRAQTRHTEHIEPVELILER